MKTEIDSDKAKEIEQKLSVLHFHTLETHSHLYNPYELEAIHNAIDSIYDIIQIKRIFEGDIHGHSLCSTKTKEIR